MAFPLAASIRARPLPTETAVADGVHYRDQRVAGRPGDGGTPHDLPVLVVDGRLEARRLLQRDQAHLGETDHQASPPSRVTITSDREVPK